MEVEPNDTPTRATPLAPSTVYGVIASPGDADLYRFRAAAGSEWVLTCVRETEGSGPAATPLDPLLEILRPDGSPVVRVQLQATRASVINFRPIDSFRSNDTRLDFWDEMELNEYLYMNGEVVKLYQAPKGPDSGFVFYESPANSHRINYFGTSATAHALFEPVYTVAPHAPEEALPDNGLPVFEVPYANDDDPEREWGERGPVAVHRPAARLAAGVGDGRLPRAGPRRARRGRADVRLQTLVAGAGARLHRVRIAGKGLTPAAGSGTKFEVRLDRHDGWSGPVTVAFANLPEGFAIAGPLVIQAGHFDVSGVLRVAADAPQPTEEQWKAVAVTATGVVDGEERVQALGDLGKLAVGPTPKLTVRLEPDAGSHVDADGHLVIRPGETITANLVLDRQPGDAEKSFDGEQKFDLFGLPHGVIVDNIGLSGVLIRQGETERQIFLSARDSVPPGVRPIFARSDGGGRAVQRRRPAAGGRPGGTCRERLSTAPLAPKLCHDQPEASARDAGAARVPQRCENRRTALADASGWCSLDSEAAAAAAAARLAAFGPDGTVPTVRSAVAYQRRPRRPLLRPSPAPPAPPARDSSRPPSVRSCRFWPSWGRSRPVGARAGTAPGAGGWSRAWCC